MEKGVDKLTAHIINHTHWDREWRYPLWDTRFMLIEFMDELIELMEQGNCQSFLIDGQVIPILDYLQIRPEMIDRIKTLVQAGKLEIGPWYTLPDEFPVDGEALVRNLLWGIQKAGEFGKALMVGYTPFGWGQTAQLPQIYRGFGIDTGFIGKRVSKDRAPKSEFLWKAPDGSEMLTSRFGVWGRQNFYFFIHLRSLFNVDHLSGDWHSRWHQEKTLFHQADEESYEQDYFRLNVPDTLYTEVIDETLANETWQTTDESVVDSDRLMMNGCDYSAAQRFLPKMIEKLNQVDAKRMWKQSTLAAFVETLRHKVRSSELPVVEGELRDGPAASFTGNALMTRSYIKFLNKKAQNMLIRYAEPLSVLASIHGAEYPKKILDVAWDNLLKSHPHDSINAVTQDDTADDVQARLKTVISLSKAIGTKAMQNIIKQADLSPFDENDILLMVINPLPYERNEVVTAWIDVPADAHDEYPLIMPNSEGLMVIDAEGESVSTQWLESYDHKLAIQQNHTRAFPMSAKRHKVAFDTGLIPAGGYKVFKIDRDDQSLKDNVEWSDQSARTSDILKSPNVMENQYLKVLVNPNGTFDLTNKETNRVYTSLNYYEDHGEHGDYWVNEKPHKDKSYNTLGSHAKIWTEMSGPLLATIVTEVALDVPQQGDFERRSRGSDLSPLMLRTYFTLKIDSKQVDVKVEFENQHKDHCLRAMLPTGISKSTHADVGEHFNTHSRPICSQGPTHQAYWPDMGRLPFNDFVDVSDGQEGFAVINDCLTEYEVSHSDERVLALTLLRSVRNSICTELRVWSHYPSQEGGQCLGKHEVNYSICLHAGTWSDADIDCKAQKFNAPVRVIQTNRHEGRIKGNEVSLFSLSNQKIRFSALKKCENSNNYILRIYNPTVGDQAVNVQFKKPIGKAWLTNLNEERENEINVSSNTIGLTVLSKKIITMKISFKETDER